MAKVYSRNLAHRQLSVSDFAQNPFKNNTSLDSVKNGPPAILGIAQKKEMDVCDTEFQGRKPSDRALKLLACRGNADVRKRGKADLRLSLWGKLL